MKPAATTRHGGMWNTQDVIPDGIRVAPRPWIPACAGKTRGDGHIRWNTQDVIPDGIRVAPRPWIPACAGKTRGDGRISGGTPKMSLRTVFAWPRAPGFRPAPERRGETAAYQVEHPRCHCGRYSRGPAPLDSGLRRKDEGRRPHIMWNTQDVIADGIRVAPRPWIPD